MTNKLAFGTDGWRAILADQFTVANVRVVAEAIARYTREIGQEAQGIIVGYDTRFMGRRFAQETAKVLAAHGIKAYLVNEPTPTPVVAFGVRHFAASGAVMITASHNPPEYNGMKYIPDYAGPATVAITNRLEEWITEVQQDGRVSAIDLDEAVKRRTMEYIYLRPHYEAHLRRLIRFDVIREAKLCIVTDPMHGAGIGYVSGMLRDAGVATANIRHEADPLFGGGLPEPTERHLQPLREEVVRRKAQLGLANDGDADRFGVVNRFGEYIPPNQVIALLARHLIKNRGYRGRIVRTVATTHLLDRMAERYGLELVETPVGFKYIGAEMNQGDVLIGGEESGGLSVIHHIPEKDGILANLLVTEMCAWEKKELDQLLRELHEELGELFHTRIDVRLAERERLTHLLQEPARIGPFRVERQSRQDGLKLYLEGGHWVLIRPSGTEPLMRIYCEADSVKALESLKEAVREWIAEVNV